MHQQALITNLFPVKSVPNNFVSYDTKFKIIGKYDRSTLLLFGALQNAKDHFEECLFDNILSPVILTLNRKPRSLGYYIPYAWETKSEIILPEININPKILHLPPVEMMSILVHEMCHHYHYMFGKPGRNGYHNKQFATIMLAVGLMCSNTGIEGGKQTGQRMSHYIIEGGKFESAFYQMPKEYILPFKSYLYRPLSLRFPSSAIANKTKTKYQCPMCNNNAWGKPNMNIQCNDCNEIFKKIIS